MERFSSLRAEEYVLDTRQIGDYLAGFCRADRDSAYADAQSRAYYRDGGALLWADRLGVGAGADTLLRHLQAVGTMGFSERAFFVEPIRSDLSRLRQLDFDEANPINKVVARLEYRLTKAYLRLAIGQRFGYTNPERLLNHLDPVEVDSNGVARGYHRLFDIPMQHPDASFLKKAASMARSDSLGAWLSSLQVRDTLYRQLQALLPTAGAARKRTLLANMERRRWRVGHQPGSSGKYVLVNVPAFHLWGVSPDTVVDMRIGCGALKTKTPLLTSAIERMDVNPEWHIPMSIIAKDVARHAGDSAYFARNHYYIAERKTGRHVPVGSVTASMLQSGAYRVSQEGGDHNSLGRIIFRFPNKFSVFLHYTSNPGVFARDNRGVSHGCVRVQHPFELARFLLAEPDDWTLDRLRISMGLQPETEQGLQWVASRPEEERGELPRLVSSLSLTPRIPLYIIYYTIYPSPTGELLTYSDVYGYDKVLAAALECYQ